MSLIAEGQAASVTSSRDANLAGTRMGIIRTRIAAAARPGGDPALVATLQGELEAETNYVKILEGLQKLGEAMKSFGFGFLDRIINAFRPSQ